MISPYAYKDRQWCGYDDVQSVETKVEFQWQSIYHNLYRMGEILVSVLFIKMFVHLSAICTIPIGVVHCVTWPCWSDGLVYRNGRLPWSLSRRTFPAHHYHQDCVERWETHPHTHSPAHTYAHPGARNHHCKYWEIHTSGGTAGGSFQNTSTA